MGIEKEVVKQGSGPKPQKGQTVTVHCTGEPTAVSTTGKPGRSFLETSVIG
jgi:hypothetical protein